MSFLYVNNIKELKIFINISDRILNNDYSFDIRDYDEGDISDLK